jgi:hypothetical protein
MKRSPGVGFGWQPFRAMPVTREGIIPTTDYTDFTDLAKPECHASVLSVQSVVWE